MGELTYVLDDKRISRAIYAEWKKYAGTSQAGWHKSMFLNYEAGDIETLYALGIIRFEPKEEAWYLTEFAINNCVFERKGSGPLVVIVSLE